jgi:hypothetical protein
MAKSVKNFLWYKIASIRIIALHRLGSNQHLNGDPAQMRDSFYRWVDLRSSSRFFTTPFLKIRYSKDSLLDEFRNFLLSQCAIFSWVTTKDEALFPPVKGI